MKRFMKKKILGIPVYGIFAGILLFVLQRGLYDGSAALSHVLGLNDHILKLPIDDRIPLVLQWASVYTICYLLWITGPMMAAKCGKQHFADFVTGYVIANLLCALILTLYPTVMDRAAENLFVRAGEGFWGDCMRYIYLHDGGELARDLFPSFHCLLSVGCWLAVVRRKEVPMGYRIFAFTIAVLVFPAVVFTKQHYTPDWIGGLIAAVCILPAYRYHWGRRVPIFSKQD